MLKIKGYSDDIIEIDGWDETNKVLAKKYHYGEIDCFDRRVKIWFTDGTIILCDYGKPEGAIWLIKVLKKGTARQTLTICLDEDSKDYSDIFEIDAEIEKIIKLKQN